MWQPNLCAFRPSMVKFWIDKRPLSNKSAEEISRRFIGSVLGGGGDAPEPNIPSKWREQAENIQCAASATPSALPLLIANDTVHGQNNLYGATIFPHHIGQGCMRDANNEPDGGLVKELAAVAALESYACGLNWIFTPCAAVPQDLRWGRTYEGFSEDPSIVAKLAAAEVEGVQGQEFPMAACLKHWVGDGGTAYGSGTSAFAWTGAPTGVLDQGDTRVAESELRSEHVSAYLPGLKAGCLTVMASYSSWQGDKLHAHRYLLTDMLKGELVSTPRPRPSPFRTRSSNGGARQARPLPRALPSPAMPPC
jgi:beta-glucosidase